MKPERESHRVLTTAGRRRRPWCDGTW